MPELTTTESVLAALAAAVVLAALHLLAPRIRKLPLVPANATGSFAGGLAVAYVFLHLLPELSEGNKAVGDALQDVVTITPLLDLGIFLVALAGFLLFYGLERLAQRSAPTGADDDHARGHTGGTRPGSTGTSRSTAPQDTEPARASVATVNRDNPDSSADPETSTGSPSVFRLHLASFFLYNALITYTMALRFRTGVVFAVLFTVAMGLHFVLTDRGLEGHYGSRFGTPARALLAAGLLAGWALAAVFAPTSTLVISLLTAFLGGSILLNVFKEEIPSNRGSSFGWFVTGLVGYAALLAITTYFAE